MPHICVEYSANLEDKVDVAGLCEKLRLAALETGIFPLAGIRVRAFAAQHHSIADGNRAHGFIDISVRLREGRPQAAKADATALIFEAARQFLEPVLTEQSVALSLETREIDAELAPKTGTIAAHLEGQD